MGNIYVTSDVHGQLRELKEGLKNLNFSKEDTLYIVGDILDKGEDSFGLLRFVKENENIVHIKGNHEYMLELGLKLDKRVLNFVKSECVKSFKKLQESGFTKEEVYKYLENLPYYKIINDEFLLVHAGIDLKVEASKEEIIDYLENRDNQEFILNDRRFWLKVFEREEDDFGLKEFTVIIGHTPMQNRNEDGEKSEIGIRENKYGKKVICLDNAVFAPSDECDGKLALLKIKEKEIECVHYVKSKIKW